MGGILRPGLKKCLLDIRKGCSRRLGLVGWPRGKRHDSRRRPGTRRSRLGVALWEKADLSRKVAALEVEVAGMERS